MNASNRPLTVESLTNDIGHVGEFLRTLETVLPGHVDEELLTNLEGLRSNRIALDLLVNAMNAAQQPRR